jgi:hypothetical protein
VTMKIIASCSRDFSLHSCVNSGLPIGTNSKPGGGCWSCTTYGGDVSGVQQLYLANSTLNSSFFFLSLLSTISKYEGNFVFGWASLAVNVSSGGARGSRSFLASRRCLSLAGPSPAPGNGLFSLPILNPR